MIKKKSIFIVDDHKIFREGLKSVLSTFSWMELSGEAENGKEFLSLLEKSQPDIVLIDIAMPLMNGIEATEIATKKYPGIKIIGLSGFEDKIYYYRMIKAGAFGFINKKSGIDEIEAAIVSVLKGQNYFSQDLLRDIIINLSDSGEKSIVQQNIKISNREKEVLLLICKGFSNKEIAEQLNISDRTVDKHRTNLLAKTATKNSANLVMFAIQNKLIEF